MSTGRGGGREIGRTSLMIPHRDQQVCRSLLISLSTTSLLDSRFHSIPPAFVDRSNKPLAKSPIGNGDLGVRITNTPDRQRSLQGTGRRVREPRGMPVGSIHSSGRSLQSFLPFCHLYCDGDTLHEGQILISSDLPLTPFRAVTRVRFDATS
jgi:hypothetical protein